MSTLNEFSIQPKVTIFRPTAEELRAMTAEMPNAFHTSFDNYNVHAKVDSRSKKSTFVIDDDSSRHSDQCVTREEADRLAALQDEFIRGAEMICVDGYIGNHPKYRTAARLCADDGGAAGGVG